jgi:uncharacterized membrane protein
MRNLRLLCIAAWGGCMIFVGIPAARGASFQGLGDLPGGTAVSAPKVPISSGDPAFESHAYGVSPNGNVVVGSSVGSGAPSSGNSTAFKWTAASGIVDIGYYPNGIYYATATGATNNDLVTGYGDLLGNYYGQIMQWSAPSGSSAPTTLPLNPPWQRLYSYTADQPIAINSAGKTVIAGYLGEIPYSNSIEAAVWVDGAVKRLGWLGPGISPAPGPTDPPRPDPSAGGYKDYSYTFGINTPATDIVGYSQSGSLGTDDELDPNFRLPQAVIWHDPTGTWESPPAAQSLGFIGGPGVGNASSAADITNNGVTVVGSGCIDDNCGGASPTGHSEAFIGTVGNLNLTALGVLPVNDVSVRASSRATAIAGDGTTVVGWSTTDVGILQGANPIAVTTRTAFIWDSVLTGGAMMNLKTYLTNNQGLGAALNGWTLKEATGISDDGRVIVGTGINPQGNYEAFRVMIDLSIANNGDYNGDHIVDAADYTVWRDTLGTNVAKGTGADGNGNGMIDSDDYTYWKSRFGMPVGSGSGIGSLAVPEPAPWLILLTGWLGIFLPSRWKK